MEKAKLTKLELISSVCLLLALGSSASLLMTLHIDRLPKEIRVGALATKDLYADQFYSVIDEKKTSALQEQAASQIRPVYDVNPAIEGDAVKTLQDALKGGREFLDSHRQPDGNVVLNDEQETMLSRLVQEKLGVALSKEQYDELRTQGFRSVMEQVLEVLVRSGMKGYIVASQQEFEPLVEKGIVLREITRDGAGDDLLVQSLDHFTELEPAKKQISKLKLSDLDIVNLTGAISKDTFGALQGLAQHFIRLNVNYNSIETEARRQNTSANVPVVKYEYERGQPIFLRGDRLEERHVTVIDGINKARLKTNSYLKFVGVFLFVNLILLIVFFYATKYIRKFQPTRGDLIFLGSTLIFTLIMLRIGVFLGSSIRDALPFEVGLTTLYYAIPVAVGAMLVRFVMNSESALVYALVVSLFAGIFLEHNLELTIYYLISGVFAAHVVAFADKRATVLLSGVYSGLLNAVLILSLNLITIISIADSVEPQVIVYNCLFGFLGGLFTAMTLLILTPISEGLFNYTTDIKLLELANLSHPLLKQLIVRAPGTYHHSQLVGILAEAGAEAIGANPLLARVASYYHDIGKMKKPQYFIENQLGENPHDKLTPSMSSLIITAHVKDGIEMAQKYKLPQRIADMIPQHQGTKLIGYFYSKAKQHAELTQSKLDEQDYRYPGPKPQTREAGIIMLADAIEACVRALSDKSPARIRGTVENLVSQHFVDEQLDECNLTLKDLHQITQAFVKILIGIYHQRIEYPEGALIAGGAEVKSIMDKKKASHEGSSQQRAVAESNITTLFRKKD